MKTPEFLGQLVLTDRRRLGLTQDELVEKLTAAPGPPRNVFTKRPFRFCRSWLAKLETGYLKRSFPFAMRQWLADILEGDRTLYESLPMSIEKATCEDEEELDVMPLIRRLARAEISSLSLSEFQRLCEVYRRCEQVGVSFVDHWNFR